MKTLFLVMMFMISLGCYQKQEKGHPSSSASLTEADLRSTWVELTRQEAGWVIFEPCEASNFSIHWEGDSLIVDWGQEATVEVVSRIVLEKNKFLLEGTDVNSDPPHHTFRIEPIDSLVGHAWWWVMTEKEPRLLVKESMVSPYPVVKESCEGLFEENPK